LTPPDNLDPDGDGKMSAVDGWTLSLLNPDGLGPSIPGKYYTGVYGKWVYLPDEQAYLGVIDPFSGDVFAYKPSYSTVPVPEPSPVLLLVSGLALLILRKRKLH
jgi:hypothetical protein